MSETESGTPSALTTDPAFEAIDRKYRARLVAHFVEKLSVGGSGKRETFGAATDVDDDADDLAQETLIRAARSFSSFDKARAAWPWLVALAKCEWVDWVRSESATKRSRWKTVSISDLEERRRERLGEGDDKPRDETSALLADGAPPGLVVDCDDPEAELIRQESARLLIAAHNRLPEPARDAFSRWFSGQTAAEVAAAQGVPESTADARIRRAVAKLRAVAEEGGADGYVPSRSVLAVVHRSPIITTLNRPPKDYPMKFPALITATERVCKASRAPPCTIARDFQGATLYVRAFSLANGGTLCWSSNPADAASVPTDVAAGILEMAAGYRLRHPPGTRDATGADLAPTLLPAAFISRPPTRLTPPSAPRAESPVLCFYFPLAA